MRISELATRSGVPVATIKTTCARRCCPRGSARRHAGRLRLRRTLQRLGVIRALVDAGVGISGVRKVVAVLEEPPENPYDLLGAANAAVTRRFGRSRPHGGNVLLERMGGSVDSSSSPTRSPRSPTLSRPSTAPASRCRSRSWTLISSTSARSPRPKLAATPETSIEDAVPYVVLGTALVEPLILALRRVAEQVAASIAFRLRRRLNPAPPRPAAPGLERARRRRSCSGAA